MTVLELMERTGLRTPERAYAYIKDGLLDLQTHVPEKTKRYTFSVEKDVRYYSLPSDMVNLLNVYRKYDSDGRFIGIPRISNIQMMQDSSSSTATSDDLIIVI